MICRVSTDRGASLHCNGKVDPLPMKQVPDVWVLPRQRAQRTKRGLDKVLRTGSYLSLGIRAMLAG